MHAGLEVSCRLGSPPTDRGTFNERRCDVELRTRLLVEICIALDQLRDAGDIEAVVCGRLAEEACSTLRVFGGLDRLDKHRGLVGFAQRPVSLSLAATWKSLL